MKRIIALLIAIFTVLSVLSLASCAEQQGNNDKGGDTTTQDNSRLDHLPELDFEGTSVKFAVAEGNNGSFTERSIRVEEENGNSVDSQIIARNAGIEERLNVTIDLALITGYKELTSLINSSLASGDTDYDVIGGYQYFDINLATKGYLLDLNKLDAYGADYIDFDADYWAKSYNDNLQYQNIRYWITGDLSLRYTGGAYCTFVNAKLYNEYLNERYGDIYDFVRDGKWTIDALMEMSKLIYGDLNTNEKVDEEDRVGYALEIQDSTNGLAIAADVKFSETNPDGSVVLTFGDDKTVSFMSKLYQLVYENNTLVPANSDSKTTMEFFASGNLGFCTTKVHMAEVYLREMNDDYYIIPFPKFDLNQAEYKGTVHDGVTIFGINYALDEFQVQASAATLELMAAETLRIVTPEYYDNSMKYKYTRDDNAADMIDIIRNSVTTDFVFAWSSTVGLGSWIRANINPSVSSQIRKSRGNWEKQLATLIESLEKASVTA